MFQPKDPSELPTSHTNHLFLPSLSSACLEFRVHFAFSQGILSDSESWSSVQERIPDLCPLAPTPQLLEYLGKGKSIVDVGLAQARHPLSTRSHYFEVEIVDPGEKCYIALGLARKVGASAVFLPVGSVWGCWDGARKCWETWTRGL